MTELLFTLKEKTVKIKEEITKAKVATIEQLNVDYKAYDQAKFAARLIAIAFLAFTIGLIFVKDFFALLIFTFDLK